MEALYKELKARGFKTVYRGLFDNGVIKQLEFGTLFRSVKDESNYVFAVQFDIDGLPLPKGSKVWLRISAPAYDFPANVAVFENKHDAVYMKLDTSSDPFDLFWDHDYPHDSVVLVLSELEERGSSDLDNEFFYVVEVELP